MIDQKKGELDNDLRRTADLHKLRRPLELLSKQQILLQAVLVQSRWNSKGGGLPLPQNQQLDGLNLDTVA